MSDQAGGIVIGGCRIGRMIGRGGMGTVYRAVQIGVERPVAVKLMPITSGDDAAIARFQREARTAGALDHPHCLPLHAAGDSDGLLYLVMRLVHGPDLERLIDDQGWLPPGRAATVITQIAGAVQAAHDAGLVHRDLKPANILIEERDGRDHAYVSDFGLMRAVVDEREITLAGQWLGTPAFAAPEQMEGQPVGPPADIYALGAILDYMLGPQRSKAADAVITHAMEHDPADRFRSAREFGDAAERALAGARSSKEPSGGPTRWVLLIAPLIVVLAAAGAAAVLVLRHRSDRSAERTTAPPPKTTPRTIAKTTGRTTSQPPSGNGQLQTSAYTATLPDGLSPIAIETQMSGYRQTVLQNQSGSESVIIDRTPHFTGTLAAKQQSVAQSVVDQTPDYKLLYTDPLTVGGVPTLIWAFSQPGPGGERVDVMRVIDGQLFAVLGRSASQAVSYRAATAIAYSIKVR